MYSTSTPRSEPIRNQPTILIMGRKIPGRALSCELVSTNQTNGNIGLSTRGMRQKKLPVEVSSKSQLYTKKTDTSVTPPPITPPLNQYGQCFQDFISIYCTIM